MEVLYPIDAERMNQVLRKRRLNLRWEELWELYLKYQPPFSRELFDHADAREVMEFACCFQFSTENVVQMRKELSSFVKSFPKFRGNTLDEIRRRMYYTLWKYNDEHGTDFPGINWLPDYGGLLHQPNPNAQIEFMQRRRIPCPLTGLIPRTQ